MAQSLYEVFNKFAGKEVLVIEAAHQNSKIAPEDTVVAELKQEIESLGLKLRLKLPGDRAPMNAPRNSVNVDVYKDTEGKFRIGAMVRMG